MSTLAKTTLDRYRDQYNRLVGLIDSNEKFSVRKLAQRTYEMDLAPTTRKNYLNAILHFNPDEKKLIGKFIERLLDEIENLPKLTDSQTMVLMDLKITDIDTVINKIKKNKNFNLGDYTMLWVHRNYAPRNDLMNVKISYKKPKDIKQNWLYIDKSKKEAHFIINTHKTSKRYGTLTWDATDIYPELVEWSRDRDYYLTTSDGKPLDSSAYSHRLERIFKHYLPEYSITANTLRKMTKSDKFGSGQEFLEDCEMMGHSPQIALEYYCH